MKSRAAVLRGVGRPWEIEEIEVHAPKTDEVLVEWKVAGLCHSDDHMVTGDLVPPGADAMVFPFIGGHEGAGVVLDVGPGVTTLRPGVHVVGNWIPSCGRCRFCANGRQNLCDAGGNASSRGWSPTVRTATSWTGRARSCSPSSARSHSSRRLPRYRSSGSTTTCRSRRQPSSVAAWPPDGATRR